MSLFSYLHKVSVYPTLWYGVFLESVGLRTWYTRVDEHCVIGAMPMRRNYKEIVEKENIKAILTLNKDHELALSLPRSEWSSMGIDYMQIGIDDYIGLPDLQQIVSGVEFINKHKSMNQCVYVHCKAGRYRSAFFVACYLINSKKMTPDEAIAHLKKLRPIVMLSRKSQYVAMKSYYDHLNQSVPK